MLGTDGRPCGGRGGVAMTEVIAGVEIPDTEAAVEATRLVRDMTSPLLLHHS
jgi:hypothetical protein